MTFLDYIGYGCIALAAIWNLAALLVARAGDERNALMLQGIGLAVLAVACFTGGGVLAQALAR